jgi:assimilatory nitrate reductase catalytic subunit
MNASVIKTTCPYCGVGCGVLAAVTDDGRVEVTGDPEHPANSGRICSKGAALGETIDLDGRLLYPEVDGVQVGWDSALTTVADGFSRIINEYGPDSVAFYVSGQLLTEDYYVANKLMKGFIGSANIDTNSRLCMSSTVAAYKRAFGTDTMPCCYEDLERAKLVVLVGSNLAWCHPVLFQRLQQAKLKNTDLMIVVIDPRQTTSCEFADLHLSLLPGTDAVLFNGLLTYINQNDELNLTFVNNFTDGSAEALSVARASAPSVEITAEKCGLKKEDVARFFTLFSRTERVVTAFSQGVNQSTSGVDKVNSIINCHLLTGRIGRPGMGPFSLTGQSNAMGGREVGGLANQLAAHMEIDNRIHRDIVQDFWQSPVIADHSGLKAVDLFNAIDSGVVKAVWIMCTNPVVSLPDASKVTSALAKCELVVVSDCIRSTDTTALANVLLPALAWGEKQGSVTNSERCISRQRSFLPVPGEARADWWIISQVATRMGFGDHFSYQGSADIFREHAALSGAGNVDDSINRRRDFDISWFRDISDREYQELQPVQWPVIKEGAASGTGVRRMFADGKFFTPSGKAQLISVVPRLPVHATDQEFPYILNTGRSRDQWHTMTRTGKSSRLTEHSPEPYAEIHPLDVANLGVNDGELIKISSRWGDIIVRLRASENQKRGNLFVPIHWNGQFASNASVGKVVNPAVDLISGQPEFKHTPVQLSQYQPAWHGFLLSRRKLKLHDTSYWARATGDGYHRYELAGEQAPADWAAWARSLLCSKANDVNWVEYLDVAARRYRGVRLVDNRVESCIFIAPDQGLPSRSWLGSLFVHNQLADNERKSLLSGRAPAGQVDVGRIVCACLSVGENTIINAISRQGLTTTDAVGKAIKAGTNCGSCLPEIQQLLNQY